MHKLLELRARPTTVMCSNDLTAIGALNAAHVRGLQIPREISIVGFDDIQLSGVMQPPLTTIRIARAEIASRAFMALYGTASGARTRRVNHVVSAELITRSSMAPTPDKL